MSSTSKAAPDPLLAQVLPELVSDMEPALLHLGRGDLVKQLKQASLGRWSYDEFSDTAYLYLRPPSTPNPPDEGAFDPMHAERLSLYDELGVNLDCDAHGRLRGIEILEGRRVAEMLNASMKP